MRELAEGADSATVQFATAEDVATAMKNNPTMIREFAKLGEEEFIKKYIKVEPEKKEEVVGDIVVASESTQAPVNTLSEDERKSFEEELETLRKDRERLIAENDDIRKRTKDRQAVDDEPITDIVVDDIKPEDLFEPEKAGKFIENYKKMAQIANTVNKKINKLSELESKELERKEQNTQKAIVENERAELDNIRRANPQLFIAKRPLADIEGDYIKLMRGIAESIGHKGAVYDSNGQFVPSVAEAFVRYKSDANSDLRKQLDAKNIKLPDDFSDVERVSEIRGIQRNNLERGNDGQFRPWSYQRALNEYLKSQPKGEDPKMVKAREKAEAEARAIENRKAFATELPASGGASPIDLSDIDVKEFERKISEFRHTGSPEAKSWLETVTRSAGWSQKETDELIIYNSKKKG